MFVSDNVTNTAYGTKISLPKFLTKGSATFQLEVSENKAIEFCPIQVHRPRLQIPALGDFEIYLMGHN